MEHFRGCSIVHALHDGGGIVISEWHSFGVTEFIDISCVSVLELLVL